MDSGTTVAAIAAAVIAAASLVYGARAANAAKQRTAIQRQLREDAAQRYVWADLRPSQQHGYC